MRTDKADASRKNPAYLRWCGIRRTVSVKVDQVRNRKQRGSRGGRPQKRDPEDGKARRGGEYGIARIARHRAVATGGTAEFVACEATAFAAAINDWL